MTQEAQGKRKPLKWYHVSFEDTNKPPKTAIDLAYRVNSIADYLNHNRGLIGRSERRRMEREYDKAAGKFLKFCSKFGIMHESLEMY